MTMSGKKRNNEQPVNGKAEMNMHDIINKLTDPASDRTEFLALLSEMTIGAEDLLALAACFPPERTPGCGLSRIEVMDLLDEAGHDVGQAGMDLLEADGSFERTGQYVLDRKGRQVPCYRPADYQAIIREVTHADGATHDIQ